MHDFAMLEVSKARQEDIRREIEKARRGMDADGTSLKANRSLPGWVNQLLHRKPFAAQENEQSQRHLN